MLKSKKLVLGIALGLAAIASIIGISLCSRSSNEIVQADAKFAAHISAFTSGNISIASTITIRLTDASPAFAGENKPVAEELFDFSPSVEGLAYWIDAQTVEFRPAKLLKSGTTYEAKFYLSKVKEVESEFKKANPLYVFDSEMTGFTLLDGGKKYPCFRIILKKPVLSSLSKTTPDYY